MDEQQAMQWCVQQFPTFAWLVDEANFNTIFWIAMAEVLLHVVILWVMADWLLKLPWKIWKARQRIADSWRSFMADVKGGSE